MSELRSGLVLGRYHRWSGRRHGDPATREEVVNDVSRRGEPMWDPADTAAWRAIWAYSTKRAVRENQTLNTQEARAQAVIDGTHAARSPRSVKTTTKGNTLDTAVLPGLVLSSAWKDTSRTFL